jgi:biotin carboxylase
VTLRMIMIGGWTDIFEKAKACKFDLTVVQRRDALKPRDLELIDQVITSPLNDKGVIDIVTAIHQKKPFDIVLSFQEMGLLNAALLREQLGIRGNPLAPVMLTRDKGLMRKHMPQHGIPSIPYAVVSSAEQTIAFGREAGWPIIVKPANGVGSLHIHKLFSEADVAGVFEAIRQDPLITRLISHDFPAVDLIAEKFVEGPEVSVEAMTWEGQHTVVAVTDKLHCGYPTFVETGHSMPSALPAATLAAIEGLTRDFLASIGHLYGPTHTEIIVSDQGPVIIESHTRTGGDNIFEMVQLACGVDMFGATLQGFAGSFPPLEIAAGSAAIRFLSMPAGRITGISGLEEARASTGVVRCELAKKVGDVSAPVRFSDDRCGYVLARGAGKLDAIDNVDKALRAIRIEVDTQQYAVIVDPFSSGRFLMDEFASRGIASIAVLSNGVPAVFRASYIEEKFARIIAFDGDLDALAAQLAAYRPLCVMVGLETGLELVDRLAEKLGLPGNPPQTTLARRDKYAMHEALRAKGVRAVKQRLVDNVDDATAWLAAHATWPVVVKPSNSAGSDGVSVCDNLEQALRAVSEVLQANNLFDQRNAHALLQEYLDGREWVVDTVSCDGRHVVTNVTRYLKVVTPDANVVYRHAEFMPPDAIEHRALIDYALAVNDALDVRYGAVHSEIIMTASGPALVEVNARMHGANAIEALGWCNEVTQLDLSIDSYIDPAAFASKAQRSFDNGKHLMVHFLIAAAAGTVDSVIDAAQLTALTSYKTHSLPAPGSVIDKTVSLTTTPGTIWLLSDDADALLADQEALIAMERSGKLYSLTATPQALMQA